MAKRKRATKKKPAVRQSPNAKACGPPRYRSAIPKSATEIIEERLPDGSKQTARYELNGELVGRRWWDDGQLCLERPMRQGRQNGTEYDFYWDGAIASTEPYRDGKPHGTAKQWSPEGELLITYTMINGTGVDLWCDWQTRTLSEECHRKNGSIFGYSRRWNTDDKTIYEEYHIDEAGYHGITREWNDAGKLKRGFPKYHVKGRQVSKRQYLAACRADSTLPLFLESENKSDRELPAEYISQRANRSARKIS
jgi:antitoxin component YwqK of YwqJK toxin-antitoxin module